MRRLKNFLVNAALFSAACVLCLAGLETGLRCFYPQMIDMRERTQPHPKARYVLSPNRSALVRAYDFTYRFTTNSLGLRGREPRIREGAVRILGVGDSMTFGWGVDDEETFLARLEKGIRARGHRVDVFNAGVPGYGPDNVFARLPEVVPPLRPHWVVLGFFSENDVQDVLRDRLYVLEDGRMQYNPRHAGSRNEFPPWSWMQFKEYLKSRCHTYVFLRNRLIDELLWARAWLFRVWRGIAKKQKPQNPAVGHNPYSIPATPYMEEGWTLTRHIVREMKAYLAGQDVEFMVVGLPSLGQVREPDCVLDERGGYTIDVCYPMERMESICEEEGIAFLNLLPAFREAAAREEELFFPRDQHLNEGGHRLAAEHLLNYLLAHEGWPLRGNGDA
jgi:lysophospholipase L1-like esterase